MVENQEKLKTGEFEKLAKYAISSTDWLSRKNRLAQTRPKMTANADHGIGDTCTEPDNNDISSDESKDRTPMKRGKY